MNHKSESPVEEGGKRTRFPRGGLALTAAIAIVIALGGVAAWWLSNDSVETTCPQDASAAGVADGDLKLSKDEDAVYKKTFDLALQQLEKTHKDGGEWEGGWSESKANATADSYAAESKNQFRKLLNKHCRNGVWDTGWSQKRAFDEAVAYGEEVVKARVSDDES